MLTASFLAETKSSLLADIFCSVEQAKIDCEIAYFDTLGDAVQFIKAIKMRDVEDAVYG